ncbi:MAG: hypothetical protein QM820_40855 [Minicystis sp.]
MTDLPGASAEAERADTAPVPAWHETLPSAWLRIAAIGERDAVVAGEIEDEPLVLGGRSIVAEGPANLFVTRVDARGRHRWTKAFGGPGRETIASIAAGDEALVLAGASEGGVDFGGGALGAGAFLAKLDGSGQHLWSRAIAGAVVGRVRLDGEGNIVVLIGAKGPIDFGDGAITSPGGVIVAKLDARGRHVWSKTYGPEVAVNDIAVTRTGAVVVVGRLTGRYDFGGGVVATSEGPGNSAAIIVAYKEDGSFWWNQRWGGFDNQEARRVVVDDDGNVFVHLKEGSGPVLGLYGYGASGQPRWNTGLGGMAVLAADHEGNVVYGTVSYTSGAASLGMFDAAGRLVWTRGLGSETKIHDLAVTPSGAILIAGRASGPTDLGGGVVLKPGAHDRGFVAALGLSSARAGRSVTAR